VLLEELAKDGELSGVVTLAGISEPQGSSSLDRHGSRIPGGELADLIVDELVLGTFEKAALGGLYQLEDRSRHSLQEAGVVREDLEEIGIEHPE
jgi:hypothetical protein